MGCLYQISFPNGKRYIGITVSDPRKRLWEHRYQAKAGKEYALSRAIRKYGLKDDQFQILAIGAGRGYLAQLERNAIRVFGTRTPGGYNLTDGGDGAPIGNLYNLGKKRTAETRAQMSASKKGKRLNLSPEMREKRRVLMIGNKHSLGCHPPASATAKQVAALRGLAKTVNSSGVVGVSFDSQTGKWRATITLRCKTISLGRHASIEEASAARSAGERKYFSGGEK